uniref:Saposin B-type domain-containing protein n=1 Tax=Caenorhabditis tropicalis TaxID=1561998 RepID=A0A1I7T259_9PELO
MKLFLVVLASFYSFLDAGFHEECHETLREGRIRIETVAENLAAQEIDRLLQLLSDSKDRIKSYKMEKLNLSPKLQDLIKIRDGQPPCPQPNATMFTTSTPSTTTTTSRPTTTPAGTTTNGNANSAQTSAAQSDSTSASPSSSGAPLPDSSSSAPPSEELKTKKKSKKFNPSKVYVTKTEDEDPFSWYMKTLHYYMGRESEVCNNKITDLNSVTEDQLFGFFSTLAASHPGPFCSLCHRFTDEIHSKVLKPNSLLISDDEYHISHLLYEHFPFSKSICTAIAPGCSDNYALKVANLTESVVCLECTACMSITNVLQHKIFLQPAMLDQVYYWLHGNLFHNICAELCLAFQGLDIPLFPHGLTYDGCQNVMKKKFYQLIEVATVITRPERFCSLEIQWCELNEQPNALHCLREMCQEYFKDTPQTRWLCSQIPDRPEQADAFLNIHQTKVRKEKKLHHVEFEKRGLHDEL